VERALVLGDVDPAANLGWRASLTETPRCPGRPPPQTDCFRLLKRRLPMKRRPLLGREPHRAFGAARRTSIRAARRAELRAACRTTNRAACLSALRTARRTASHAARRSAKAAAVAAVLEGTRGRSSRSGHEPSRTCHRRTHEALAGPAARGVPPVSPTIAPSPVLPAVGNRRQPCPPHLSRISLHFGCISQTIAFSEASHDRPADVVICEYRCMDSLQSNVTLLTGCGGGMYNLIYLFPTSFKP